LDKQDQMVIITTGTKGEPIEALQKNGQKKIISK